MNRRAFLKGSLNASAAVVVGTAAVLAIGPIVTPAKADASDPRLLPYVRKVAELCPWADEIYGCFLDHDLQIGISCRIGYQGDQWRHAIRFWAIDKPWPSPVDVAGCLSLACPHKSRVGVWGDDQLEGKEEWIGATT